MSDDDTLPELLEDALGEDLDDELFDGDDKAEDADGDDDLFDDGDEDDAATAEVDASEDGDDELDGEPAVDLAAIEGIEGIDVDDPLEVAAEVEGDVDDTIRDGEFVCSSCHMAKRSSALADPDELLCRDCV